MEVASGEEKDNKKQKIDNNLLQIQLLTRQLEETANKLEEVRKENNELKDANMKLLLQNLQNEKYSENRNGEGNWWSAAIQKLFDNITDKFDPSKTNRVDMVVLMRIKLRKEHAGDMKLTPPPIVYEESSGYIHRHFRSNQLKRRLQPRWTSWETATTNHISNREYHMMV